MIDKLAHEAVLARYLIAAGCDPAPVLRDPAFERLDRVSRLDRLARVATTALEGRPEGRHLALVIGREGRLGRFGLFGHAMLNCSTVAQAMRFMLKHMWIVQDKPRNAAVMKTAGDVYTIVYLDPPETPETPHFRTELFFSAVIAFIRELSGGKAEGVTLDLVHDPGCPAAEYEAILGVPVAFRAAQYRLTIPRTTAERALPASYITHSDAYLTQCDTLLSQMKHSSGVTAQVRRILLQEKAGFRDITTICRRMNVSERTLRRRLAAEGTSFQAISDDVRNHLARSYLSATELSVADIAGLLGYFDAPTFRKAFKKWNGETPASFKQRAANSGRS